MQSIQSSIILSLFGLLPLSLPTLFLFFNLLLQFHCSLFQKFITGLIPTSLYDSSFPATMLFSQHMIPAEIDATELTFDSCDRCQISFAFEALVLFRAACVELSHYLVYILLLCCLWLLLFSFCFVLLFLFLRLRLIISLDFLFLFLDFLCRLYFLLLL